MPPSVSPSERREIQRRNESDEGDGIKSDSTEAEKEGPEGSSSNRDQE